MTRSTQYWLPAVVICAFGVGSASAKTFSLPSKSPAFSITFPENWAATPTGDVVTARIQNMTVSVFPIEEVRNLREALESVKKRVGAEYEEFHASTGSDAEFAGMKWRNAKGSGKRKGVGINMLLYAFASDCDHYFGISSSADYESAEAHLEEANSIVASIKTTPGNQRSTEVSYPREKAAFAINLPCFVVADVTSERLMLHDKRRDTSLYVAEIPQRDGVTDLATAQAWLAKNGDGLLKRMKLEGATSFSGPQERSLGNLERPVLHVKYDGGGEVEFHIWIFAPDGRRHFYAYAEIDSMKEIVKNDELGEEFGGTSWAETEMQSIRPAK